jgi:membrane-bound lytic murein transglycosylase B
MRNIRFLASAALACALFLAGSAWAAGPQNGFGACVQSMRAEAATAGVSAETLNEAFKGVTSDPAILALTRKQSEFVRPVWAYLESAASGGRISAGRAKADEYDAVLQRVESQYGVDKRAIMGVWGMETNYGANTGGTYVIRALATLACARYRGDFFRTELLTALQILEEGHLSDARQMRGSWAGAMGQTQFMPTSFMKYAVDYNGDGHKNIWTNVPDALASTANYLKQFGWVRGLPWGIEVELPAGIDLSGHTTRKPFSAWASAGVSRADGGEFPAGEATLILPAGVRGPAFLVTQNFYVIKKYNNSESYALGVAHLGDRIFGGSPIQGTWPKGDRPLSKQQGIELQRRLQALGHDVGEPDGKLGEKTREAVRKFQITRGMVADGYATPDVLARLKTAKR